jgi:predicted RNase H-like HicB family nuclease
MRRRRSRSRWPAVRETDDAKALQRASAAATFEVMRQIHYTLYREDSDYVAQCLDYDVSSFGSTKEEALAMLKEAVELYLADETTLDPAPEITDLSVGELLIA